MLEWMRRRVIESVPFWAPKTNQVLTFIEINLTETESVSYLHCVHRTKTCRQRQVSVVLEVSEDWLIFVTFEPNVWDLQIAEGCSFHSGVKKGLFVQ